ncbi:MAG: hypothetical protein HY957_09280 [Nitrospirae bacterium]|nr:hypothetical protein [Nitrospirota bacterium]
MNYQLGHVVAERELVRHTTDGREVTVQLRVGEPLRIYDVDKNVQDWFCPLQIMGMGDGKVRAAFGVDSLQALLHALILAGSLLQSWSQQISEKLTWLELSELGLPPAGILQGLSQSESK